MPHDMSQKFTCKCGKTEIWIAEGKETLPCPECARKYIGVYDKHNLKIIGREVKKRWSIFR